MMPLSPLSNQYSSCHSDLRMMILNPLAHVVDYGLGIRVFEHDFVMKIGPVQGSREEDCPFGLRSYRVSQDECRDGRRTVAVADGREPQDLEEIRHGLGTERGGLTVRVKEGHGTHDS